MPSALHIKSSRPCFERRRRLILSQMCRGRVQREGQVTRTSCRAGGGAPSEAADGGRPVYEPLAEELAVQQRARRIEHARVPARTSRVPTCLLPPQQRGPAGKEAIS